MEGLSRRTVSLLFILKVLSGVAVWFVYTYYYTNRSGNDVFRFFDDAGIMFGAIYDHPYHYIQMVLGIDLGTSDLHQYYQNMANWYKPWASASYHNNRLIIQFNALVYLFSFGYYNVHTVFMCFLSMVGLVGVYKTFSPFLKDKTVLLTCAVFLIPSVLFWGSGLLKEGIILFALGMLIYKMSQFLFVKKTVPSFIWLLFCLAVLSFTKVYILIALAPSLIMLIVLKKVGKKKLFFKFLGIHLLLFILSVNVYRINPKWDVLKVLSYKQWSFKLIANQEAAGSLIQTNKLKPTTISFLNNAPEAVVNTLFRPYFFEAKTLFMFVSGLENLVLIIVALLCLVFFKKPDEKALPLLYTSLFFVFSLALIIGIVNPVLGSIVRFRIPLLPFYAISFIFLLDKEKLLKRLPFFKLNFMNKIIK